MIRYYTVLYNAILDYTTLYHTILYYVYHTIHYTLYYTLSYTMPYYTILDCIRVCCIICPVTDPYLSHPGPRHSSQVGDEVRLNLASRAAGVFLCTGTPQLPFKTSQIPSNRDHTWNPKVSKRMAVWATFTGFWAVFSRCFWGPGKAQNRGTLRGLRRAACER